MKTLLRAVLPLLALQWGCTITAVSASDDARTNNLCSGDDPCVGNKICSAGVCQTLNGTLEALLISASPPSDSTLPHLTFFTPWDDIPTGGGSKQIAMPGPVLVTGSLSLPSSVSCYPSFDSGDPKRPILNSQNGTVPVTVTLAQRQSLLGLSQQVYYTKTGALTEVGGYTFGTRVPAGEYDVYMSPPALQVGDCVAPPQLYRDFPIGVKQNTGWNAFVPFKLSTISKLKLVLRWPSSRTLDGWTVDIIEPVRGNSISTQVVLGNAIPVGGGTEDVDYKVPLAYSAVIGPDGVALDSAHDLLRLRPPDGMIAPTVFINRRSLELLQTNPDDEVQSSVFSHFPNPVRVFGQMLRQREGTSTGGFVSFVSTAVYGIDQAIFASFQATTPVKPDGQIDVLLPPGTYRVRGEPTALQSDLPDAQRLSAAETTWNIPADVSPQYGKVVELPPITELSGGVGVPGAEARAQASFQLFSPLEAAFGMDDFVPRASSGLTDDRGHFALQVDPGRFDVLVQAPEELGFGWYVRPGVLVGDAAQDLGPHTLPLPTVLFGTASVALQDEVQPLASCAIRAYAYLNKDFAYTRDPQQAVSLVQVAETRADANGGYRLLLPEALGGPK
jgi:hypothetical protein